MKKTTQNFIKQQNKKLKNIDKIIKNDARRLITQNKTLNEQIKQIELLKQKSNKYQKKELIQVIKKLNELKKQNNTSKKELNKILNIKKSLEEKSKKSDSIQEEDKSIEEENSINESSIQEEDKSMNENNLNLEHNYYFIENKKFNFNEYSFIPNEEFSYNRMTIKVVFKDDFINLMKYNNDVRKIIEHEMEKFENSIKISMQLTEIHFEDLEKKIIHPLFYSKYIEILSTEHIENCLNFHLFNLMDSIEEFEAKGSGYKFLCAEGFNIRIQKYSPFGQGCYIKTPNFIANKKATINIKNENDNFCFKYCMLYHFNKSQLIKDAQRLSKYNNLNFIPNFEGINYPTTIEEIKLFEKNNNISINVYGLNIDATKMRKFYIKLTNVILDGTNDKLKCDFIKIVNDELKIFIDQIDKLINMIDSIENIKKLNDVKNELTNKINTMNVNELNEFEEQLLKCEEYKKNELNFKPKLTNVKITDEPKQNHCNLLILQNELENEINGHYIYITDFHKLLTANNNKNKYLHCPRCHYGFSNKHKIPADILLKNHINECKNFDAVRVEYPHKEFIGKDGKLVKATNIQRFKNFQNKQIMPYVFYADTEAILTKNFDVKTKEQMEKNTQIYQNHMPISFSLNLICAHDEKQNKHWIIKGFDSIEKLLNILHVESIKIKSIIKNTNKQNKFTHDELQNYENSTMCHICEEQLYSMDELNIMSKVDDEKCRKVLDHNHLTGEYRGAAHNICNINFNLKSIKIPVFIHNLKNYDGHFIIQNIANFLNDENYELKNNNKNTQYKQKFNVIPNNTEKFLMIEWNNIRFLDSYAFLNYSLDTLSKNLDNSEKYHTMKYFKEEMKLNEEQINLLLKKGQFCYDYFDSIEKFKLNKLPDKSEFYSNLYDEEIKDEDYNHALNVWNKLNCQTLEDYHDIYLKTDVFLLTDVFENFRKLMLKHFKLDPCFYITAPSMAYDAMLKFTNVNIELITDPNIFLMFEQSKRGGFSGVCEQRYAKANNPYMKTYDNAKPNSYIVYVNANNLYGNAMSMKLPISDYQILKKSNHLTVDEILNYDYENDDYSYEIECDLNIPISIHKRTDALPLCPENIEIIKKYNIKIS